MTRNHCWLRLLTLFAALVAFPAVGQEQTKGSGPEQTDLAKEISAFHAKVFKLLDDQRWDELDSLAKSLYADRPKFSNDWMHLYEFYLVLCNSRKPDGSLDRGAAENRVQQLEAWHKAKPSSASRIALADALVSRAWAVRGTGFADTVTREAEQTMTESARRGDKLLSEAELILRKEKVSDPYLYSAWMGVGIMDGFPRDRMLDYVDRSLEEDPWFSRPIEYISSYLLPRWHGKEGDLLWVAKRLSDKFHDRTGDFCYAMVFANAFQWEEIEGFRANSFEWPRVRQGLTDWLKRYPQSPHRLGLLAKFAHLANDRQTALDAIGKMKGNWDKDVFEERRDFWRTELWAKETQAENSESMKIELGPYSAMDLVFVKGGTAFIVGAVNHKLQVRSVKDGAVVQEIPLGFSVVELLATSQKGDNLVFTSPEGTETEVLICSLESEEVTSLGRMKGRIRSLTLSADEQFVVVGNDAGALLRWKIADPPVLYEWKTSQTKPVTGLALSPDSQRLVSGCGSAVQIWELSERIESKAWTVKASEIETAAWSPTEPLVATAGFSNRVNLWSTVDGSSKATLVGGNTSIQSLKFSPNGKRIVAGTMSAVQDRIPGEVVVWDLEQRRVIHSFAGNRMGIWKVNVSPDGSMIASASEDGTVRFWKMP